MGQGTPGRPAEPVLTRQSAFRGSEASLGAGVTAEPQGKAGVVKVSPPLHLRLGKQGVLSLFHPTCSSSPSSLCPSSPLSCFLLYLLLLLKNIPTTAPGLTMSQIHLHPLCVFQATRETSDETNGKE